MTETTHRHITSNGISMHLAERGDGDPVIFVHGFPELHRSWKHQMAAVADAGYKAIAPDMRGYGRTDAPERVEDYDILQLTGDLVGILDEAGYDDAIFVGHDWGAWVVWYMALMHADRVSAVVNHSVGFIPRSHAPPIQLISQLVGDNFFYQVYFQDVGPADEELARDVRTSMLRFAWSLSGKGAPGAMRLLPKEGTGFLDTLDDPPGPLDWFPEQEVAFFVGEFEHSGFFGPLSWYRNMDRNWELTPELHGAKVQQPALFVAGENDPVLNMISPDGMEEHVPNLRDKVIVPGSGHWVHMEHPEQTNEALLGFLRSL